MTRASAVLVTVIVYHVILLAIGIWSQRRVRDGVDYFLGGRRLGPVVAAISASASSSSVWTLLGVSGLAWSRGLSAVWLFPACVGGFLFNWYVVAPRLRPVAVAEGAVTVTEVLAGPPRRGRGVVIGLASAIILFSFGAYVAAQFLGAGKSFSTALGFDQEVSIVCGAAVVIAYTFLGGFWGVSLTDTLQGLVMVAACIFLPVAALARLGGIAKLWDGMRNVPVEGYADLFGGTGLWAGAAFAAGTLGIGLGYPGQPHVVNRFMALREGRGALAVARHVSIAWAVCVYAGMLVVGWAGRVLVPSLEDAEDVIIKVSDELLHPVLAGVVLAAILSAILSTADSQLLVGASTVTEDLGWNWPRRLGLVGRSRLVVFVLGAVAVGAALLGSERIFGRVLFAWTALGAAFGPVLLVRLFRGPLPPATTTFAMSAGFLLTVFAYSFAGTRGGLVERVLPFAVALLIAVWGSRRRPSPRVIDGTEV